MVKNTHKKIVHRNARHKIERENETERKKVMKWRENKKKNERNQMFHKLSVFNDEHVLECTTFSHARSFATDISKATKNFFFS